MVDSPRILLVTGLSGGGRSTFLRTLEDTGYHCIDHLPAHLIQTVIENFNQENMSSRQGLAIGIDIRNTKMAHDFILLYENLKQSIALKSIFVMAEKDIILRRYSETRRRHPLLVSDDKNLQAAIDNEKKILAPVQEVADMLLDTSTWSPHNLARYSEKHFVKSSDKRKLAISVISFGFKHGLARPIDCLFDVRFLANPYFDPKLRDLTGKDVQIGEFIAEDEKWDIFFNKLTDYVSTTIPYYYEEGKHYLHIAIGCTGGQHRSVYCAEKLAEYIRRQQNTPISVNIEHRDLK